MHETAIVEPHALRSTPDCECSRQPVPAPFVHSPEEAWLLGWLVGSVGLGCLLGFGLGLGLGLRVDNWLGASSPGRCTSRSTSRSTSPAPDEVLGLDE